jgi:hypothetical protein
MSKEQIKEVEGDLKTYASLQSVANSDGGKLLIKGLKKDVLSAIDLLIGSYKTAPEIELRTACASLRERITLLRALNRAPNLKRYAQKELDELLALDSDEEGDTV